MRSRAMRWGSKGCASQSCSAAAVSVSEVPCCALAASVVRMFWICCASQSAALISWNGRVRQKCPAPARASGPWDRRCIQPAHRVFVLLVAHQLRGHEHRRVVERLPVVEGIRARDAEIDVFHRVRCHHRGLRLVHGREVEVARARTVCGSICIWPSISRSVPPISSSRRKVRRKGGRTA